MTAKLSLLIPNYERPASLCRLLDSVFAARAHAGADDEVAVVVVDDYSQADIAGHLAPYAAKRNFVFRTQAAKRGNAEAAFLGAIGAIETPYVWLLGNDDQVELEGISHVLALIAHGVGFILLNPRILREAPHPAFVPLRAEPEVIRYERCEQLFDDFGFVTSTTTFPCIVVETQPLRAFHVAHDLTRTARVYSHTFSIFCAFFGRPALFSSRPVVTFTLNELLDESAKLRKQIADDVVCFHQTLGLARLVRTTNALTGTPLPRLGAAQEDELSKSTCEMSRTTLAGFLAYFLLEQLRSEVDGRSRREGFRPLSPAEIDEMLSLFASLEDPDLASLCARAVAMARRPWLPRAFRAKRLLKARDSLSTLAAMRPARPPAAGTGTGRLFSGTAPPRALSGFGLAEASHASAEAE